MLLTLKEGRMGTRFPVCFSLTTTARFDTTIQVGQVQRMTIEFSQIPIFIGMLPIVFRKMNMSLAILHSKKSHFVFPPIEIKLVES